MATEITTNAIEKSTYVISVSFTDEDDQAVIPDTIVWSLTNDSGDVINSRDQVSVTTTAATVEITLSGNDLAMQTAEVGFPTVRRRIIIEATYDSSLGNDLPLKSEAIFLIENLTKVA